MKAEYIDLTHTIDESIPVWPGNTPFSRHERANIERDGCQVYDYHLTESIGTHIDAPSHFVKDGRTISDLTLEDLIGPVCVLNVSQQVKQNPDYAIAIADIEQWEHAYGVIPKGSIVIANTGWASRFNDAKRYVNQDENGALHFPGFSAQTAELLVGRQISGVGIDTLSLDPGPESTYPAHHIFLNADIFQIENLANTDKIPPQGSTIYVLPMKVRNGPEAPARIIVHIPIKEI